MHRLLMFSYFLLLHFVVFIFPAEQFYTMAQPDAEVVISLGLSNDKNQELSYVNKRIKFFQKFDQTMQDNDLCVEGTPIFKFKNAEVFKKSGLKDRINRIPLKLISTPDLGQFKPKGTEIFRVEIPEGKSKRTFIIQLDNVPAMSPKDIIDNAKNIFNVRVSCGVLTKHSLVCCDNDNGIKCEYKELLGNGIIAEVDGKIVHGPNSYFPEEYNKRVWEYRKKLLFFYAKKSIFGFGFLFACYLLWKYSSNGA